MNWRKPLIFAGLHLTGSKIPFYLEEIKRVSKLPQDEIKKYQDKKLEKLLLHSYQNVPYYHKILPEAGVIIDGEVHLKNFGKIPILTKEIIGSNFEDLKSRDLKTRTFYENHTGGSTGQPLIFLQDKYYEDQNFANKLFFCGLAGKDIGKKEMKIWGSEKDLVEGTSSIKSRLTFWLYNRLFENSFNLDTEQTNKIIQNINSEQPDLIWGYVNSLLILSRYINENNLVIKSPRAVISAAGTLTEDIRSEIKQAFNCKVLNVYGSREMGDMVYEDVEGQGLSVFQHSHYLEVINRENSDFGDIIVTSLNNYSFPFIRYKIGDISEGFIDSSNSNLNYVKLKNVVGRETGIFKTKNGKYVPPEFFIHIVGVVYNTGFIKQFQVIQKSFTVVLVKIVLKDKKDEKMLAKIDISIKKVMGDDCEVRFDFVDVIAPSKSGKYLYTISEVN
ncbi:putative capsular polysaccharide biosynthesis protein [Methanosarcina siciliae C2J]|uniref:Putative capsular polysaccharide biosynthesis protein n=1 Tax=Methanosarcina siciliae C2J TaxID=1434118 RepID=A0A0E3PSR3_9EURY|nr:phenylacetate--CoA ligase family protein [Methanosarcina siciliae]AKB37909.1 putative capsular polysaccharide biosynthesis protein [Methanosarcina siciliae C2J]